MMRAIDVWYIAKNVEEQYWTATGAAAGAGAMRYALTGNPATLQWAGRMASFGVRAHANAVLGVLRTPLMAGGTTSIGGAAATAASAAVLGYTIGALAGTAISQAAFGDEGGDLAADLYLPGGKSFFSDALFEMHTNAWKIGKHYLS